MTVRSAEAEWKGTLKEGSGTLKVQSGRFESPYTWASRFSDEKGTNPEELVGVAHAGCYSMFLSALLTNNGYVPTSIHTTADVHLEAGPTITKIELVTRAIVPSITEDAFQALAAEAKAKCPVSKALAAVPEVTLDASLVG
jgi:osmotically inducible protein OsmC